MIVTTLAIRGTVFAAIYLILVGQLSADEIGLGFGLGILVLGWSIALDRFARLRFSFSRDALAMIGRAVIELPRAIVEVAPALVWRRRGRIGQAPLAHGGQSSVDAGRRAAALLATSLAPDRYALRWTKRNAIEIHRLAIEAAASEQIP